MKDFFDTWKFKILVGIAVFLAAIMAYAGANGRLTAAPQEILSVAVAPFQRAAAAVSNGVSSLWEKYTNIDAILEENEKLTTENAELRGQMVDYDKLKAENEAYKALTNIQEQHPEMSYVSSFVIGRDPLDSFYGFTLDKGSLDGVEANDAITSDEGYLLGVVTEVDLTSCKVMTILHPSFNAAGVVSRTRDNGIITGSADYAAEGLCILSNLSRSTLTKANDQVITTGLGGVFPPDVLVGVVQELVPEASGKSTIAVLKPAPSSMCLSLPITDRRSLSMESRRKRKSSQIFKWVCYTLLMLLCTVLQTMPGLFQLGAAKPLYLLPLALAVSVFEGEFAGAVFGAVCGLMWDYTAGRTVGMLALELMILSFAVSAVVQLYLKDTAQNFLLIAAGCAVLVLACDWLFFYYMPGYSGAWNRFLWFVLPSAVLSIPVSLPIYWAARKISIEFKIDNGVV